MMTFWKQNTPIWKGLRIIIVLFFGGMIGCGGGDGTPQGTDTTDTTEGPQVATLQVTTNFEDPALATQALQESFTILLSVYTAKTIAGCDGLTGTNTNGRIAQESQTFSSGLSFTFEDLNVEDSPVIILAEAFNRANDIMATGCKTGVVLEENATTSEEAIMKARVLQLKGEYGSQIEVVLGSEDFEQIAATIEVTACLYICQPQELECRDSECTSQLDALIELLRNLNELLLNSSFDTAFNFDTQGSTVTGNVEALTYYSEDIEGNPYTVDLDELNIIANFAGNVTQSNVFNSDPFLLPVDVVELSVLLLEAIQPSLPEELQDSIDQLILLLKVIPQIQIESIKVTITNGTILDPNFEDIGKFLDAIANIVAPATGTEIYSTSAHFVAELQ